MYSQNPSQTVIGKGLEFLDISDRGSPGLCSIQKHRFDRSVVYFDLKFIGQVFGNPDIPEMLEGRPCLSTLVLTSASVPPCLSTMLPR